MADSLLVGLFLAMAIALIWFICTMSEGTFNENYGRVAQASLPAFWNEDHAPSPYGSNLVHPIGFWYPEGASSGSPGAVSFCFFVPWGASKGIVVRTGGGDMYTERARQRALDGAAEYAARKFSHLAAAAAEKLDREVAQARAEASKREAERVAAEAKAAKERTEQQARWDRENAEHQAHWRAEQAAAEVLKQKIAGPILLNTAADGAGIVFGTDVERGEDIRLPLAKIPHTIVAGASGSGKSVFLHQLVYQLAHHSGVEQIIIVDMKGGVEFARYQKFPAVRVEWEFPAVMAAVEGLVKLMEERQAVMLENGWQNWRGKRVFFVVDEYAEIQNDIDDARADKSLKPSAVRMEGNLVRLARRARALGIVFICAMQKGTTDAIDSSVKGNLSLRICFRAPSREAAAALLDDWDDAPKHPQRLKVGRFLYFDASRGGKIRHMQTHIAPGVEVARDE